MKEKQSEPIPISYGIKELMIRYNIGEKRASQILRSIEYVNDGLALGRTKALWSEVEFWEKQRGRIPTSLKPPEMYEIQGWQDENFYFSTSKNEEK